MTKEKARELLPVIQAYSEGKSVQISHRSYGSNWEDYKGDCANFDNLNWKWRIKPEPREFWLVCRKDCPRLPWGVWTSEPPDKETYDIIHVIEALK